MRAIGLAAACFLAAACSTSTSGAGGADTGANAGVGGDPATGSATSSTGSAPADPEACVGLADGTSCAAAGCLWENAFLYPAPANGDVACEGPMPFSICTYYRSEGGTAPSVWKRDVSEGRVVLEIAWSGIPVAGFSNCADGSTDPCTCF